jgi:hypothetical protein
MRGMLESLPFEGGIDQMLAKLYKLIDQRAAQR